MEDVKKASGKDRIFIWLGIIGSVWIGKKALSANVYDIQQDTHSVPLCCNLRPLRCFDTAVTSFLSPMLNLFSCHFQERKLV